MCSCVPSGLLRMRGGMCGEWGGELKRKTIENAAMVLGMRVKRKGISYI